MCEQPNNPKQVGRSGHHRADHLVRSQVLAVLLATIGGILTFIVINAMGSVLLVEPRLGMSRFWMSLDSLRYPHQHLVFIIPTIALATSPWHRFHWSVFVGSSAANAIVFWAQRAGAGPTLSMPSVTQAIVDAYPVFLLQNATLVFFATLAFLAVGWLVASTASKIKPTPTSGRRAPSSAVFDLDP